MREPQTLAVLLFAVGRRAEAGLVAAAVGRNATSRGLRKLSGEVSVLLPSDTRWIRLGSMSLETAMGYKQVSARFAELIWTLLRLTVNQRLHRCQHAKTSHDARNIHEANAQRRMWSIVVLGSFSEEREERIHLASTCDRATHQRTRSRNPRRHEGQGACRNGWTPNMSQAKTSLLHPRNASPYSRFGSGLLLVSRTRCLRYV